MPGIASVILRHEPNYRSAAVIAGFQRHGYRTANQPNPNPRPDDVLLVWNRYSRHEHYCKQYEAVGAKVIIMENGYIGQTKALARSHHNGAGWWPEPVEDRWSKLGIELKPWRTTGDYVLVLPQRGIGETGVAMPRNWLPSVLDKLRRFTDRPIKIRKHPGMTKSVPLEDDLARAWACVTWGSGAGIKALAYGVPVIHEFRQWIGAPAASGNMDIESPVMGNRLAMFQRLAWAQWTLEELASGEAFEWLL